MKMLFPINKLYSGGYRSAHHIRESGGSLCGMVAATNPNYTTEDAEIQRSNHWRVTRLSDGQRFTQCANCHAAYIRGKS